MAMAASRILIADTLDPSGLAIFAAAGAEVHQLTAEERPRLPEILANFDALIVRSSTQATAELLKAGKRLKVVGRAGIGVDNVDVAAATDLGILVVNAPTANLLSATEHTFALLLSLARRVPEADASMKAGGWDRKLTGVELQGKTLGVIGFGRIGQRVAERARAFAMKIAAYDPFLDAAGAKKLDVELLSLDDLLSRSDAITFHTPLTKETRNLLNAERIATMKKGALVINCGRGGVIDEEALLAALESGHLGGAALDVFAEEPPKDLRLVRHKRWWRLPTWERRPGEAQERISIETAEMVVAALAGSLAVAAVNLPFRPAGSRAEPYMALGESLGKMAGALLGTAPRRLQVDVWGVDEALHHPLTVAVLKGVLTPFLGEAVNYVNAEKMAEARGVEVVRSAHTSPPSGYPQLVDVTLICDGRSVELGGTPFGEGEARVVRFENYPLEFRPQGTLLVLENHDRPGVVGKIGTLLAEADVNIADIHLARRGQDALAVLRLDQEPGEDVLAKLIGLDGVKSARKVLLG